MTESEFEVDSMQSPNKFKFDNRADECLESPSKLDSNIIRYEDSKGLVEMQEIKKNETTPCEVKRFYKRSESFEEPLFEFKD